MKLALHIGTPKTGTTSLQRWFSQNREALQAQGLRYAQAPGQENHRKLATYARDTDKPDESFAQNGIHSAEDHAAFRSRLAEEIAAEVAAQGGARVMLMSNEHIFSKINTAQMAARLRDLLAPLFDGITVYLHLRPQIDLMMSNASQLARIGRQMSRAEITRPGVGPNNYFYGYNRFLQGWESVFGAENIRLVPFRREPDMTDYLIRNLGIDSSQLPPPGRENTALDWRAIALANVVNRALAAAGLPQRTEYHLDTMPGIERIQPGRALAQELQARFADSNAALVSRRSDLTLEDLTPDWADYPEEGNLHLVDAPCVFEAQIGHMLRRNAEELALERWRRHIAEGKLAAMACDEAGLRRAQRQAKAAAAELDRLGVLPPENGPAGTA
ncbi:hypothetical protein SAMN04488103_11624 [Gemmobacter aquatilis]|uniref:Sulfotransferase family protein n=1 Tax=Gemmobacter aquatilis TaxID=933059 RepID=A0A1H8N3E0_9RHOB|nr:hypothetical protein [Gemmobacter aquatilis]SEO24036.1 hypothetical protein SAMN04488103_11624 [Gemmobacter aquatilis]